MVLGSVIGIRNNSSTSFTYYGMCSTDGSIQIKTVTIPNFQLVNNTQVIIKFNNDNSSTQPMLNINNTGSKSIYYKNKYINDDLLKSQILYNFIYYNNVYELIGEVTNSIIIPTTMPDFPVAGQIYFNTTNNKIYIYNNEWLPIN